MPQALTDRKTGGTSYQYASDGAGHVISGALDSTGRFFPLDSCQQTVTKDSNGNVTQVDAFDGVNTWRQSWTYTSTTTVVGQWVKQ